ncbi:MULTISPECIES: glycoside hydrolase family protein [Citrobacter]|uniref:glycoside hydrolase family protein n=1 Tax=Citrobacter TaxID=544 RepID=UPI0011EDA06B|nr:MULTISPECIES: lysozyme [Citrobacter]EMC3651823.1 lysozyme [Citrobacter braakii]KAA0552726.1 lysozyme [Citrobacter braakii]MBJ8973877.1 lysozyme [Citrobacter braakii]MDM3396553.1 lysozyme [Citrobacter sp. Cb016]MDT7131694.1 lysozyme [Citrobacter braakii]
MPLHSTQFTPACIAFIKQWQGLSLEKYQDKKGIWVIGYGHEITADESFDAPIMLMQAETLLFADINICEAFIHKEMPQIQDRFQQEALIAWMLSVGISQFCSAEFWPGAISQPETV